jgi:hypothetical protein
METEMAECRMCGLQKKLGKSHVIPEAFFRVDDPDQQKKYLISEHAYPKKAFVGVYDSTILCLECEKKFARVDDYGSEILIRRFDDLFNKVDDGTSFVAVESDEGTIDQDLLARFFIAVLWRASVSTHPYFSKIKLGPYEASAAQAIDRDVTVDPRFSVVLSCWKTDSTENADLSRANMDPFPEKWDGIRAYRFYFGEVVAYIKVDQRSFLLPFSNFVLGNERRIRMVARDFSASADLTAMRETFKRAKRPGGRSELFY